METYQDEFRPAQLQLSRPSTELSIRTVPDLIDFNAVTNPNALFCLHAEKDETNDDGIHLMPVTMRQLRDAAVRCKNFLIDNGLEAKTPQKTADGKVLKSPVVALFMDSDLSLMVHLLALMGLGVPVILISIRLSHVAVKHLLESVDAGSVIASPGLVNKLKPVTQALPGINLSVAKPFNDYLEGCDIPLDAKVGSPGHFCDDLDTNVFILHSSGTTGLPKPISQPHKFMLGQANCYIRTDIEDVRGLNMSTLPLFHGFGLLAAMLALSIGKPFYLPPARTVPTGCSVISALTALPHTRSLMTVPHILEEMVSLPKDEWTKVLRPLQFVACGGGPLKSSVGEALASAGVKILAHFGASEIGSLAPIYAPGPGYDWHYWRLRDDFDIRIEPIQEDAEQMTNDTKESYYQMIARPYGWTEDVVLQDWLLKKTDSTEEGTYLRAVGRRDETIVLATGEKVVPKILEKMLEECPLVKTAIAFGESQFEIGVIVEPLTSPKDIDEFKRSLWPVIREAGKQMDSHAKISSVDSIIVASDEQKFPRSDKGSVSRKEVYHQFETEIRQAYELLESNKVNGDSQITLDEDDLEGSLKEIVESELAENIGSDGCDVDDDLFELGADSLQCIRIYRIVQNAVRLAAEKGDTTLTMPSKDFMHKNPTIARMANALRCGDAKSGTHEETIEQYITRYGLPTEAETGLVVLLTGSTGSLGSHMLAHLVKLPHVARVICLKRKGTQQGSNGVGPDSIKEQLRQATLKGASIPLAYQDKVSVIQGQPFKHHLGLSDDQYASLSGSVTHIIHAAWPMDFKRSLASFKSQFVFLHNLLQLSRDIHGQCPQVKPRLAFISSISVVGQYPRCHDGALIVPEEIMDGSDSTNAFGYGYAKLVCENILARVSASARDEMEVCCIRLGQIAGAVTNGYWNPKEHIPALVGMAQRMGKWPKLQGTLSWLPVETCAAVVSDIIQTPAPLDLIYHVENPVRQDWTSMLSTIKSQLSHARDPLLDFDDWCRCVAATTTGEVEFLMEFFAEDFLHMACGGVILDTANARRASSTLRRAVPITDEVVGSYVREWKKARVLELDGCR